VIVPCAVNVQPLDGSSHD